MDKKKKIIFLDRDGVINKDPGDFTSCSYVTKWDEFIFMPGAIDAVKRLNQAGYDVVLISNQAGVSKGCMSAEQLKEITDKMLKEFTAGGAKVLKAYYCTHQTKENCACRKPKTGMFEKAEQELGIKAEGAYFIGDGKVDVEAGKGYGLKTVLLLCGKTDVHDVEGWTAKPDLIFNDLSMAVGYILRKNNEK